MAKKKINVADLVFKIGDDGSLKIFEAGTKKAGKAVDNLSRSEATLNRNFKGASQQSSNTTKNFSKMAQGITGGLVPAYATLAANIFAIGAAFRFLQNAADLRILQQGQLEYAQRTGQSLSILTRQLQAATGGQLAFADAAQSVAIATAAGLSTKQINQLGVVAKNASLMLGRDLTDSFNRLVRGAVKAEPELLDELGIILRLETASEKYALSIGKTAKQLNIFQKSQAVVNEVLAQGEEKFGAVETQVNQLTKLAKAFDDLVNSLKSLVGPAAEFIAKALSQNTMAVAGAGALLGTGIARAITPTVPRVDLAGARESAIGNLGSIYSGKRNLNNLDSRGIKAMEKTINDAYDRQSSTVINFEKMRRTEALTSLNVIKMTTLEEERAKARGFMKFRYDIQLTYAQYRKDHGRTMAFIKTTGYAAGRFLSKALTYVGIAGALISVIGLLKQYFDTSTAAEQAFTEAQKEFGDLFSRNAKELQQTIEKMRTYDSLLSNALQTARALSNIDFSSALKGLEKGFGGEIGMQYGQEMTGVRKYFYDLLNNTGLLRSGNRLGVSYESGLSADQRSGMQGMITMLEQERTLLIEGSKAHDQHTDGINRLTESLANPTSEKAFNSALEFIKGISKDGTIAAKRMEGLSSATQIMTGAVQDFNKALTSFKTAQTPLTRLTTNIEAVGSAIAGVGEAYSSGDVGLKFSADTGTLFDTATRSTLSTFLGKEQVAELDTVNQKMRQLASMRDYYLESGNTELYNKTVKMITYLGSTELAKYGTFAKKEAERLHDIEMGMIKDKTKVQKNLALLSVGATKNQQKQLKMQGASAQNLLNIRNQQILIDELEKKGLTKDDAQVMLEQEKLDLLHAQQIQLEKNLDTQHQIVMAGKNALESGLQTTFDDLLTGKNSSLSEGLANMAKGVFEGVSKVLSERMATGVTNFLFGNKELEGYQKGAEIIKQAHIEGISAGMGVNTGDIASSSGEQSGMGRLMNIAAGMFGLPGFSAAKGGISPVYAASGGVYQGSKAGYPAVLHGNEAVVPLPDGKSIPISGGMGGNITVNVSANGAMSSTSDGGDMYEMGRTIAQAVQNEIEKQQRPGGQLSPY
jgi:hypothetical protein